MMPVGDMVYQAIKRLHIVFAGKVTAVDTQECAMEQHGLEALDAVIGPG